MPSPRSPIHEPTRYRDGRAAESPFKRKALSLALFLILAASLLNALFGDRGLLELLRTRQELHALEQEITELDAENERLLEEVRSLKSSPLAVERLARENLNMVRPDELILLIRKPAEH
jgi:cell division protein FtsB